MSTISRDADLFALYRAADGVITFDLGVVVVVPGDFFLGRFVNGGQIHETLRNQSCVVSRSAAGLEVDVTPRHCGERTTALGDRHRCVLVDVGTAGQPRWTLLPQWKRC